MTGLRSQPPGLVLDQAARQLATDPTAAERQATAVLEALPNDPRALLILASARRRTGDASGALSLLEPLAKAYPKAANTHLELGLARAATGEDGDAVIALRHAVSLNRELPQAWRALGDLLFKTGDVKGAEAAFAEHLRAGLTHPQLKAAADALSTDAPSQAGALLRAYLSGAPQDVAALRMLAETLGQLNHHAEAESLLARCLQLDPGFDGARFTYASLLFQQQKAGEALPHLEHLLARDPDDPAYRNLLAACLSLVGDLDEVQRLYRELLAQYPGQPRIWLNYAHALRTVGRFEEAVDAYRRCIALAPDLGDAYWGLANLKLAVFSEEEVANMLAQLASPSVAKGDRLHLHYALGKALEDRGEYGASFQHYAAGAALRRAELSYSAERTSDERRRAQALFTPAFFATRSQAGSPAPDPIFVVGLPRSGSTLVEQILASHPAVEGTMELPDIGLIAGELAASIGSDSYLNAIPALTPRNLQDLGEHYLAETRLHRKLSRPFFIDKMPNNFRHVGLIHLILPQARIIDVRRHPLGAGFSAFKQHFAIGQSFSYDLGELGRYYRDYVALMDHFDAVLPGRICRVIYEDVVDDIETQVRRLLDHCGLAFDPACLRFYDNARAVKTVSSEQVRRPIFRGGLEQWRNYETWLGPLKHALGPALLDWRGETNPPLHA